MKVFLSVGTHSQSFDRLLKAVDELIEKKKLKAIVFGQIGFTKFTPKNYKFKKFLSLKEFENNIKKSDLIISHGGEGNIGLALKNNKRIIVIPRLKKFKEHTNDHQLELTKALEREKKIVAVYDIKNLFKGIKKAMKLKTQKKQKKIKIIELIEDYLKTLNNKS